MGGNYRLIYEDSRDDFLNLITKGIPIHDCRLNKNSITKSKCKKNCKECSLSDDYSRSDPLESPGHRGKMLSIIGGRFKGIVWRRLIGYYKHVIAEIPSPSGPYFLMRNGSNIGEYNYVIIHDRKYMWAKNIEIAADIIDVAITPEKDLPLLMGQVKTEKGLMMLERALKGDL